MSNSKVKCGNDVDLELVWAIHRQSKQMGDENKSILGFCLAAPWRPTAPYAWCCMAEGIIICKNTSVLRHRPTARYNALNYMLLWRPPQRHDTYLNNHFCHQPNQPRISVVSHLFSLYFLTSFSPVWFPNTSSSSNMWMIC